MIIYPDLNFFRIKSIHPIKLLIGYQKCDTTDDNADDDGVMISMYRRRHKKSGEIINKLKLKRILASSLSTYDFSSLYTTLPHNLTDF